MVHPYGLAEASLEHVSAASRLAFSVLGHHAAEVDRAGRFPAESVSALGSAGLMGLCVPVAAGGKGEGPRAFAAVVEELARQCASTAMIYVMHVTATQALSASSTLVGRDALLAEIAAGKHLTTLAFSEKGSRSHFWAPMSRLERRGEGWVTSAHKSWVTSAHAADSYVSSAQREGATSPLESTLYLARRASTLRVAGAFDGLGLRGNDSAPVSIEAHPVAPADLVSPEGEGAAAMLQVVLPWFCVGSAAMAAGLCRAAVDATAAHLSGAVLQHTGQRLRDLPGPRARLADMSLRTEEARSLLGYTLVSMERPSDATPLHVLLTRLSAVRAACEVTDLAMKACGGVAFSRQLPLERHFRDARAGWVMAPTVEHLQDFVGRALTGLPLFGGGLMEPIVLGAVAYDPRVVTIWEGIRAHFSAQGVPLEYALFSSYERQVEALLAGHVDVAWNTPLAHVRVKQRTGGRSLSLGMRDSDRDFRSKIVVRADSGIASLSDLAGRTLAVGSRDSTQARILPLHFLAEAGVELAKIRLVPFDTDVGKHGDTGSSELQVLAALRDGRAQAGALGDLVWVTEQGAGRVDPSSIRVLWTTPAFDHCMFDALPDLPRPKVDEFHRALFAMSWDDPAHRPLMELEGLRKWMPPREEGYRSLQAALERGA